MQVVIEKMLIDAMLVVIKDAIHAHPHNKIVELIKNVENNVREFVEHKPDTASSN